MASSASVTAVMAAIMSSSITSNCHSFGASTTPSNELNNHETTFLIFSPYTDNFKTAVTTRGCLTSVLHGPLRIPRHFPQVSILILRIAGISSPECIMGGLNDDSTSTLGLVHDRIDL